LNAYIVATLRSSQGLVEMRYKVAMKKPQLSFPRLGLASTLAASLLAGCGSSFLPPTDRLATAEAAVRSAKELGAAQNPQGKLHLQLAEEQIEQARGLMKDGDNKLADNKLMRASADAELAVVIAKEQGALTETERANEKLKNVKGKP
jgi:hypothetical protein